MIQNKFIILAACLLVFFSSCGDQPQFLDFQDITNEQWQQTDTLTFNVANDAMSGSKPSIIVRNSGDYQFQNIWLKVQLNDGEYERQEIQLAAPTGEWLGNKTGSLYESSLPLLFSLPSDSSTIKIIHNMRSEPLTGIQSVGILVE